MVMKKADGPSDSGRKGEGKGPLEVWLEGGKGTAEEAVRASTTEELFLATMRLPLAFHPVLGISSPLPTELGVFAAILAVAEELGRSRARWLPGRRWR